MASATPIPVTPNISTFTPNYMSINNLDTVLPQAVSNKGNNLQAYQQNKEIILNDPNVDPFLFAKLKNSLSKLLLMTVSQSIKLKMVAIVLFVYISMTHLKRFI